MNVGSVRMKLLFKGNDVFVVVEEECYTISLRWCSIPPAIQKLFGSFKGDAFS